MSANLTTAIELCNHSGYTIGTCRQALEMANKRFNIAKEFFNCFGLIRNTIQFIKGKDYATNN